ncbi:MAG: hypothetical protein MUE85_08410 [Microscillaceae bacterium]|nr:hypothetical protein [Microscillaceae bacterium]
MRRFWCIEITNKLLNFFADLSGTTTPTTCSKIAVVGGEKCPEIAVIKSATVFFYAPITAGKFVLGT